MLERIALQAVSVREGPGSNTESGSESVEPPRADLPHQAASENRPELVPDPLLDPNFLIAALLSAGGTPARLIHDVYEL